MANDTDSPQRAFAEQVVARLREAGHEALFAGGCVRDELLGRTPKDYDVATAALPDQVREVFGKRQTLAIGAAFGVITVLGPRSMRKDGAGQIEVATFRTDGDYSDGRRPDGVAFADAEHDARRRDFTINGLFYDPQRGEVIDYVGGQADLAAGVVRAIGDAEQRFAEDKLRMLRAVRFAATLGFEIDPATADAIRRHADELSVVSAERIGAEVRRMLVDASRVRAIDLLQTVGLRCLILPDLEKVNGEQFKQSMARLANLEVPSLGLAIAALLFELAVAEDAIAMARRLRLPNRDGEHAAWLIDSVGRIGAIERGAWSAVQPVIAHDGAEDAIALHEAIVGGPDAASRACRAKLRLPREQLDPPPLLTGGDLKTHGLAPGPNFSAWLTIVRAAQLDGEISTKAEALALIDRLRQ
ncbi:MAG: CCA tRNA nucleotidyltransferase [Planctomycetota bacterium]